MDNTHRYINFHRCKSSTSCPVCGSEIPNNALFCEKCGMRIHSHQQKENQKEVDRQNKQHSTITNLNLSPGTRYGMQTLSERPDLRKVIDNSKLSLNDIYSKSAIDDLRNRILNDISEIIADDVTDMEIFESLGVSFIEERDFGLDRCTDAVKEIFNLGVLMSWAHLSIEQRAELAGVYAKEVARAFELVSYEGLWIEELEQDVLGYNAGDGKIHMSILLILNPQVSPFTIIDTITHELRHQYQFEAINGYHNIPKEVVKEWTIAFEIYRNDASPCCYNPWGYLYSPIEIDARYAAETVIRNITHFLFNIKHTNKKSLIDLHKLRTRLIQEGYSGVILDQTAKNLFQLDGKAAEMLNSWLEYGIAPNFDYIYGLNSTFLREQLKMKDPAIILSYGLLMNNPSHNSKYLKGLFGLKSQRYTSKASLRSTYYFYNEIDYQNTKHVIYNGNRTVHDKLNWYGKWSYYETDGWSYNDNESLADYDKDKYLWRVDINDELTPIELDWVVGHIREHRGLYYQR